MFSGLITWAAGIFGGAAGKLLEAIIALVLLLVLIGGPFWLGMRHQEQADQIEQQQAQISRQATLARQTAQGERIADALVTQQTQTQIVYRTITKEVPHVVYQYRDAPNAPLQTLPRAVFTRGFVGLWNHALDPGLPGAAGDPADAAATDPALDSGLGENDLLSNHIANAQGCDAIRQQLSALIQWHRQIGNQ